MNPDVVITIALCFEVFLIALAGGIFVAREYRKSRAEDGVESRRAPAEPSGTRVRPWPHTGASVNAAEAMPRVPASSVREARRVGS